MSTGGLRKKPTRIGASVDVLGMRTYKKPSDRYVWRVWERWYGTGRGYGLLMPQRPRLRLPTTTYKKCRPGRLSVIRFCIKPLLAHSQYLIVVTRPYEHSHSMEKTLGCIIDTGGYCQFYIQYLTKNIIVY